MMHRSNISTKPLNERGQAQLLMVMTISSMLAAVSAAALSKTLLTRFLTIEFSRTTSLRSALDGAARILGDIYRTQAQCDPYVFNQRINQMRPDGLIDPAAQKFPSSLPPAGTYYANYYRQLDLPVSPGVIVTVSVGRIQVPEYRDCVYDDPPTNLIALKGIVAPVIYPNQLVCTAAPLDTTNRPDFESGYTMDVQLELWAAIDGIRVSQNIVFVNTCKDTNYVYTGATPDGANDAYFLYHKLVPNMDITRETAGAQLNWSTMATDELTEANMTSIRQMPTDSTLALNTNPDPPALPPATCSVDYNEDGAFNTEDIGIMEKVFRGYLNYPNIPPNREILPPDNTGC